MAHYNIVLLTYLLTYPPLLSQLKLVLVDTVLCRRTLQRGVTAMTWSTGRTQQKHICCWRMACHKLTRESVASFVRLVVQSPSSLSHASHHHHVYIRALTTSRSQCSASTTRHSPVYLTATLIRPSALKPISCIKRIGLTSYLLSWSRPP